nr:NADH dehydrogenase subunit 5 [Fulicoffula longipila]
MTKCKLYYHIILFMMFSIILCLTCFGSKTLVNHNLLGYIDLSVIFDEISVSFLFTVGMVSYFVLLYTSEYMKEDSSKSKFVLIMVTFILSMLILATSGNLFWALLGWDGLGLSSFCLIVFYQNLKGKLSGVMTFLYNRVGDVFMISSVCFVSAHNSIMTSWTKALAYLHKVEESILSKMSMLLTTTSFSKSAQIPFSAWLPKAMAAPTPVSALVHSSTLVTAGVFLTIRFFPSFSSGLQSFFVKWISCFTVMMAALGALFEWDLKKIIAFSTLSHIGFMFMYLSIDLINCALFHMSMHAIFKSLLFMCAGVVIHDSINSQDIRYIGFSLPQQQLWVIFVTSILSMMGVPFMCGFYSKDLMVLNFINATNVTLFGLFVFMSIALTCAYSMRMVYYLWKNSMLMKLMDKLNEIGTSLKFTSILSITMGSWMVSYSFPEIFFDYSMAGILFKVVLLAVLVIGSIFGKVMSRSLDWGKVFSNLWYSGIVFCFLGNPLFKMSQEWLYKLDAKGLIDYSLETTSKVIKKYITLSNMFMYSFYNKFMKTFKVMFSFYLVSTIPQDK